MKNKRIYFFIIFGSFVLIAFKEIDDLRFFEKSNNLKAQQVSKELSESIADLFWMHLGNYEPYYDIEIIITRLKKLSEKKIVIQNPIESLTKIITMLNTLDAFEANNNLKEAEEILERLSRQGGIIEVVKNKLYYETLKEGCGPLIGLEDSPTLCFIEWINVSERPRNKGMEVKISLKNSFPGFAKGVNGMHVGESRKIYIHPELANGKATNSENQKLKIFEVTVISKD